MARRHASSSAEALLVRARCANSPSGRAKYATRGLSQRRLSADTQFLLLRQLMIAHLENAQYSTARFVAEQMTRLGFLEDVAHFDASNLAAACGDWDGALAHARLAARSAPASRRGQHHWRLGRRLSHVQRYAEAARAFERAQRWAPRLRPVCQAEMALWDCSDAGSSRWTRAYAMLESLAEPGPAEMWLAVRLLFRLRRPELVPELLSTLQMHLRSLPPAARIGYLTEEQQVMRLLRTPQMPSVDPLWVQSRDGGETNGLPSGY